MANDFRGIRRAFLGGINADPGAYGKWEQKEQTLAGNDYEPSPSEYMLGRSPIVDYVRRLLPGRVSDVKPVVESWGLRSPAMPGFISNLPLGGYSGKEKQSYLEARDNDKLLKESTIRPGFMPTGEFGEEEKINLLKDKTSPPGPSILPGNKEIDVDGATQAAAQAAGVAASDFVGDGARNIWWFLNAPQAIAQVATFAGLHGAGKGVAPDEYGPILKRGGHRFAAALPATIAVSFGIGSAMRQPGYGAAVPDEDLRTKAADPVTELGARYFLGKSGNLLPYEQFKLERPDVSEEEYQEYKRFLHGNKSPLKATLEGINGPEVNFMGKSVPVVTTILPVIASIVGSRYGARKAAERLANGSEGNQFVKSMLVREEVKEIERDLERDKPEYTREDLVAAQAESLGLHRDIQNEVLKSALTYGSGSLVTTAVLGSALEEVRRSIGPMAELEPKK